MSCRNLALLAFSAVLLAGCASHTRTGSFSPETTAHSDAPPISLKDSADARAIERETQYTRPYRRVGRLFGGERREYYANEARLPTYTGSIHQPPDRGGSWVAPVYGQTSPDYQLDTGDIVRIDVFDQANLSRLYRIDGGGFISMPLVGSIAARGQTTLSLEQEIASRLSQSYLKDPKVNVEISSYRPFYILGEVRNAGQYPYVIGMTVETAVALAGGYSPRANQRKVLISRRVNGAIARTYVPLNTEISPGDTINVPERLF